MEKITSKLSFSALEKRQQKEESGYSHSIALRIHRALSWLQRSEQCVDDNDARFIFLWISFNAAYANNIGDDEQLTEQKIFSKFIGQLVHFDKDRLLYNVLWSEFSGSIRVLLKNKYVFGPFWDYQNGKISEEEWKRKFAWADIAATKALSHNDSKALLINVFSRLYVLRNQIIHGGATWNSSLNRKQIRDCSNILAIIVPVVILILMNNPKESWGEPIYPVIDRDAYGAD